MSEQERGKWIVCGGRRYSDENRIYQILDAARERLGLSYLIEGGASGADELAKSWRLHRGVDGVSVPAEWNRIYVDGVVPKKRSNGELYNAAAGGQRNQKMIDTYNPVGLIAFPGGPGTRDMVRRAEAASLRVIKVDWA